MAGAHAVPRGVKVRSNDGKARDDKWVEDLPPWAFLMIALISLFFTFWFLLMLYLELIDTELKDGAEGLYLSAIYFIVLAVVTGLFFYWWHLQYRKGVVRNYVRSYDARFDDVVEAVERRLADLGIIYDRTHLESGDGRWIGERFALMKVHGLGVDLLVHKSVTFRDGDVRTSVEMETTRVAPILVKELQDCVDDAVLTTLDQGKTA